MTEKLFPYQEEGAIWLSLNRLALLADEMGCGKSAQAITACDLTASKRVLVICPASARVNWSREFEKFSSEERAFTIVETRKTSLPPANSVIASYDLATHLPPTERFDALILDESHYLKSLDTKRTQAVFGRAGLCRRAKYVWALSGTPAPNAYPSEMWVLLYSFGCTTLKFPEFVERYCTFYESPHGRKITGAKHAMIPEFCELIRPIMMRRRKEDVLKDLPPIHFSSFLVEPGPVELEMTNSFIQYVYPSDRTKELKEKLLKEQSTIQAIVDSMTGFENLGALSPDAMKALEAMAKSVSTLRRYTGLQKLEPAASLIDEELTFNAYDKIVVFALHQDVIEGLRRRLIHHKPVTLYGMSDPKTRVRNVDRFMNNPRCRVFIGNINAAGVAITLTSAHHVLFVESSWCPGDNAQAAMRCHRIGQTKSVSVRFMSIANSIDEKVNNVLRKKAAQLTKIFDDEVVDLPEYAGKNSKFMKKAVAGLQGKE